MQAVAKAHPEDADVQSLHAESMMVLNPWKLYAKDGTPAQGTPQIVATLERVLARDVSHPGANHLYIHAVEASKDPGKGVPSADRVGPMMPNAGHLTHMPAHIYQRVGRYSDAARANRNAIEADARYVAIIAPRPPPHVYEMYMGHNHQFLAYSAAMLGAGREAIGAARNGSKLSPEAALAMPMIEFFAAMPQVMMTRFGRWSEVLAEPAPDPRYKTASALHHHARGLALLASGRTAEAQQELAALIAAARTIPPEHAAMLNKASDLAAIASLVLEGKLAEKQGDVAKAVARLEQAVAKEDALGYDEPPNWWYPVRHVLGQTLLTAGRADDAERVYRADLVANPENGWALAGLARAVAMQGKTRDATTIGARAKAAWKEADVPQTGSWL
jgi:tetratricopeptide (TPR) repeat protein